MGDDPQTSVYKRSNGQELVRVDVENGKRWLLLQGQELQYSWEEEETGNLYLETMELRTLRCGWPRWQCQSVRDEGFATVVK